MSTPPSFNTVVVAGDWHGDLEYAVHAVERTVEAGARHLFHVGDFGVWPGEQGRNYLDGYEDACASHGVTTLVTEGNHEDYTQIAATPVVDRGDGYGAIRWIRPHIGLLPRGHRFTVHTTSGTARTIVSLGGAASVNFDRLTEGVDWWPEEEITDADVEATAAGGFADVMLTHESPNAPYMARGIDEMMRENPFGWSDRGISYSNKVRARLHRAYEGVQPTLLFHGHHHVHAANSWVDGSGEWRSVIGLHKQRQFGNMMVLNLDDLTATTL